MDETTPTPLVLYDGVCHLCTSSVVFVVKRDSKKKIKFASLQSPLGQRLLKSLSLSQADFKTFVFVTSDGHYTKSTGVLKVVRLLDRFWPIFYILIVIPKPLRDLIYDWVAKSRYRLFGKSDRCFVPHENIKSRFLDQE